MSWIIAPDPHPGRCRNHRTIGTDTVRCLDYEGTPHVCTFPKPRPRIPQQGVYHMTAQKPKRWVKPEEQP